MSLARLLYKIILLNDKSTKVFRLNKGTQIEKWWARYSKAEQKAMVDKGQVF